MNMINHMVYGTYSLEPNNSSSVEIFVFKFFFMDLKLVTPNPMDVAPPVWLWISLCIA